MKLLSLLPLVFVIFSFFFTASSSAFYQGSPLGGPLGSNVQRNVKATISSQQAAQIVKKRFGGKVLKVTRSKSSTNLTYRVKIVKSDGHVFTVSVDGKTGQIKGR
jgi:starvation-inducible outer membrane lipoprotein